MGSAATTVPTEAELLRVLQNNFGLTAFRGSQLEAVKATLEGYDSIVILPTGAGKLPPHTKAAAFTVVIGPLVALMKDQVEKCMDRGIEAVAYNSECQEAVKARVIADLVSGEPSTKLLYTTPESLRQPRLWEALKEAHSQGTLMSFAIDEAHCVSSWGHDFRPAYLELRVLKGEFPTIPIAALTASVTPHVQRSIAELLHLGQDYRTIKASFNRPNIQYTVCPKELIGTGSRVKPEGGSSRDEEEEEEEEGPEPGSDAAVLQDLLEFLRARDGTCGIIYCRLRSTCDWLARALTEHDLDVGVYHAGRDATSKNRVQREWSEGAINIVVATIAFGMGIDRADVRWVVHWNAPSSLEAFYQESGRGGRDGLPCLSLLYTSGSDLEGAKRMEKGSRTGAVEQVAEFVSTAACRRRKLLAYFGELRGGCSAEAGEQLCDVCANPKQVQSWLSALSKHAEGHSVAAAVRARTQHMQQGGRQGSEQGGQENEDPQQQQPGGQQKQGASKKPRLGGWGVASSLAVSSGGGAVQPGGTAPAQSQVGVPGGRLDHGRPGGWVSGVRQAPGPAQCPSSSVVTSGLAGLHVPAPAIASASPLCDASPQEAAAPVVPQLFKRRSGASVSAQAEGCGLSAQKPDSSASAQAAATTADATDLDRSQAQQHAPEPGHAGGSASGLLAGAPAQPQHIPRAGLGLSRNGARRGFRPPLVAKPADKA